MLRAGHRVVVHSPIWPNIINAAKLRGAVVEQIDLDAQPDGSFRLDLDRLDTMMAGARAFILNSPGNPTGWTATEAELRAIRDIVRRHGAWLIADEVYSRLVYDGRAAAPSMLDIAEPDERVIVCNSFSKTWVMTGWRLGLAGDAGRGAGTNRRYRGDDSFRCCAVYPACRRGGDR